MMRHIEEVGKCTQRIEEVLSRLLGIAIKLPVELIEIDEEAKIENATILNDEVYKITKMRIGKISQLFNEN